MQDEEPLAEVRERAGAETVFGKRFRDMRVARGWSQMDIAARMRRLDYPWHQTTVAKIEAGNRPIRLNEALDLSLVIGVPVVDLLPPPFKDPHAAWGMPLPGPPEPELEDLNAEIDALLVQEQATQQVLTQAQKAADLAKVELDRARNEYVTAAATLEEARTRRAELVEKIRRQRAKGAPDVKPASVRADKEDFDADEAVTDISRMMDEIAEQPGGVEKLKELRELAVWAEGGETAVGTSPIVKLETSKLAQDLVKRYTQGESIRALASSTGRSYGFVHRVLTDSGVKLRRSLRSDSSRRSPRS